MDELNWSNLLEEGLDERSVGAWLSNANIGDEVSVSIDIIKKTLFGCLRSYVQNREVANRSLQLLRDVAANARYGVTNGELIDNIEAIKVAINTWKATTEIPSSSFQFLTSVPEHYTVIGEDNEIFSLVAETMDTHVHSKKVQQPALEILKLFLKCCDIDDRERSEERVRSIVDHILTAFQQLPREAAVVAAGCRTLNFAVANFGSFVTAEQKKAAVQSISGAFILHAGKDAEFAAPVALLIDRIADDEEDIPTFFTSANTFTYLSNLWSMRTGQVKVQLSALRLILRGLENAAVNHSILSNPLEKQHLLESLHGALKANGVFDGNLVDRLGAGVSAEEAEGVRALVRDVHAALGATSPLPSDEFSDKVSDIPSTSPAKSLDERMKAILAHTPRRNTEEGTKSHEAGNSSIPDAASPNPNPIESLSAKMARLTKTPLPKGPTSTSVGTPASVSVSTPAVDSSEVTVDAAGNLSKLEDKTEAAAEAAAGSIAETLTSAEDSAEEKGELIHEFKESPMENGRNGDDGRDDGKDIDDNEEAVPEVHHADNPDDTAVDTDVSQPVISSSSPGTSNSKSPGGSPRGKIGSQRPSPIKPGNSPRRSPFVVAGSGLGTGSASQESEKDSSGDPSFGQGNIGFKRSPYASGWNKGTGTGSSPRRSNSAPGMGTNRNKPGSLGSASGLSPSSKGSRPMSREGSLRSFGDASAEGAEEDANLVLIRQLREQIKELKKANQEKQQKLDDARDLIEITRISQQQAAVAIDRADAMNRLFNDALAKVEVLTKENDSLKAELVLLKYAPEEYVKKYGADDPVAVHTHGLFGNQEPQLTSADDQQQQRLLMDDTRDESVLQYSFDDDSQDHININVNNLRQPNFVDDASTNADGDALTTDAPTDVSLPGDLESDWRDGFSTDCGHDSASNKEPDAESSKFAALYDDGNSREAASGPASASLPINITPKKPLIVKGREQQKEEFDMRSTSSISTGMISVPSPAKNFSHGGRLVLAVKGIRAGLEAVQAKLDSEVAVKTAFLPPHELLFGAGAAGKNSASAAVSNLEGEDDAEGELEKTIQELALLAMRLFLSVKARGVGVSTDKARQSTITLVILRSLLKNWGLVDGKRLRLCDVDIVFSQLGMPSVSVQEFTYTLVVCGHKRFRKWPAKELLTRLMKLLEHNAPAEFARNIPTLKDPIKALETVNKLTPEEVIAIVRFLDTEKRALEAIFENYVDAPRYTPLSSGNGIGTSMAPSGPMNVTSATAAVTAAHVVTIRGASKMMWVGMSFEGVQQFAKEFELCPQGFAVVQLSEMFWNHVMGGSVTMWDQEDAGGALAAKVHAVSITGKNGEPMLNFKGFQSFLVVMALQCACFRRAHHHKKPISRLASVERVNNLMIWLASYGGMARIAARHRSSTVVGFRTHQLSAAAAAAAVVASGSHGFPI